MTEWQPPTLHTYAGITFYLSVIAVVALLARRSHMVSWAALVPLGVFFVLAVDAQRAIPWWAFAVPPILAGVLRDSARVRVEDDRRSLVSTAFAILLVGLALFFAPWWRSTPPAGGDPGLLTAAPPGITRALAGIVQPGDRIFDAQSWGSWLEFQYRQEHVAVDSRIELFPEHVWDRYLDVSEGRANWHQVLDDWNVDIVVASENQQGKLLPFIRKDPTWRIAYQDDVGAIFTRAS